MNNSEDADAFSRLSLPWPGLGALVLGALLAKWSWALFAPQAAAITVVPEHVATEEAGRLFGSASAVSPAGGLTLLDVRLTGVFAARIGQPGFAVLKLDGKQMGVTVGESVAPGIRLQEVHPGYVLLERAGVQQRVNLEEKAAGTMPAEK